MLEVLMAFALGVVSVFSPCILPVIPLIFAGSRGRARDAFLIVLGLTFSMLITGFTVSIFFGDLFRILAMFFLLIFSLALLSDDLEMRLSAITSRLTSRVSTKIQSFPSFLFGMLLAFLWLPCILPFAGIAISQTLLSQNPFVMLSYGIGMALTVSVVFKAGEKFISANFKAVKRIAGIIVLAYFFYFALYGVIW